MRSPLVIPPWARAVITIIIAVLIALGVLLFLPDATGEVPLPPVEFSAKYEHRFILLDREAADEAYREQIKHLFLTWLKDDKDQPRRAQSGARQARRAYIGMMDAIEAREKRYNETTPPAAQ